MNSAIKMHQRVLYFCLLLVFLSHHQIVQCFTIPDGAQSGGQALGPSSLPGTLGHSQQTGEYKRPMDSSKDMRLFETSRYQQQQQPDQMNLNTNYPVNEPGFYGQQQSNSNSGYLGYQPAKQSDIRQSTTDQSTDRSKILNEPVNSSPELAATSDHSNNNRFILEKELYEPGAGSQVVHPPPQPESKPAVWVHSWDHHRSCIDRCYGSGEHRWLHDCMMQCTGHLAPGEAPATYLDRRDWANTMYQDNYGPRQPYDNDQVPF